MNHYETVCIMRPDAGDEAIKAFIQKSTSALESGGGSLIKLDEWGRRRLAYTIQKKHEGYYFVLEYKSSPETSKEIGRFMKLSEDVLRYQTVFLEEPKKIKPRKKKKAAAEEPKAQEGGV